jgi:hypothetical protein
MQHFAGLKTKAFLFCPALLALQSIAVCAPQTGNKAQADWVSAKSDDVEISARLITGKEPVIQAVGSDLKRQYSIVELTVTPRGGYPVALSRDDFLLRSERDNERSTAEAPERIAGSNVLVITDAGAAHAGTAPQSTNIPGLGRLRRKKKPHEKADQEDKDKDDADKKSDAAPAPPPDPAADDSLVKTLQSKEIPLGETGKPVSGYLYFEVDPQQKAKNFWLHYKGPHRTCELRFK